MNYVQGEFPNACTPEFLHNDAGMFHLELRAERVGKHVGTEGLPSSLIYNLAGNRRIRCPARRTSGNEVLRLSVELAGARAFVRVLRLYSDGRESEIMFRFCVLGAGGPGERRCQWSPPWSIGYRQCNLEGPVPVAAGNSGAIQTGHQSDSYFDWVACGYLHCYEATSGVTWEQDPLPRSPPSAVALLTRQVWRSTENSLHPNERPLRRLHAQ